MKRENRFILSFFVFFIFLAANISIIKADIILSQPQSFYNLGDEPSFQVKIDSIKTGYIDINLVCTNGEENLYHNVPESTTIDLNRKLTQAYIGSLSGSCFIRTNYDIESQESQRFEISNSLDISLNSENIEYNIGKSITIKGTAIKKNGLLVGQQYNAIVEVVLNYNGESIKASNSVKDGQFSVDFSIPETTRAGNYSLDVNVFEKDSDDVLNFGSSKVNIKVIQKLSRLETAVDKETIMPGENITIIPFAYDMAGEILAGEILMQVKDNSFEIVYQSFIGISENFILKTNATQAPGDYNIIIQKENITSEKTFSVSESRKINAEIHNQTLIITNTGNVPYEGIVEIKIGENTFLKEVKLAVLEKKEFWLSAPKGVYSVNVKDQDSVFSGEGITITGGAIGIREINEGVNNIFMSYPIVWAFLFLVLALALFSWYKKREKARRLGFASYKSFGNAREARKGGVQIVKQETITKKIDDNILYGDVRKAEQVLVLNGKKSQVGVIAIKVKKSLGGITKDNLNKSLEYAYNKKGVSYLSGNYILLIFSPLLTKKNDNEKTAVKVAMEIDNFLREHNRKFRNDQISYGVGVNSGELINNLDAKNNTLQFANMGKTISSAKRISELANQEVFLSKGIRDKTASDIKVDKVEENLSKGTDVFRVKRVVNTEESQKFIQGFLRRN